MEFTGAYPKADLFDFALTQDDIVLHNNFPWSRKSMGIFNNNNGAAVEGSGGGDNSGGGGGGPKEANNNHLLPPTDTLPSFSDHTFWSKSVKMETAPLEDLGEICWPSAAPEEPKRCGDDGVGGSESKVCDSKGHEGNTDGSIYTLTVVNGETTSSSAAATADAVAATWYRSPDLAEAMDAQDNGISYQQSLDIESIISILPTLPSMGHSDHHSDGLYDSHALFGTSDSNTDLLTTNKLTQHACDDSGFVESKDESQSRLKTTTNLEGPAPSFSENNNDWSFSSNENRHNAESLLRSALQGGKSFLTQYNGCVQHQVTQQAQQSQQQQQSSQQPSVQRPPSDKSTTLKCMDTHTELQTSSVFSPGSGSGSGQGTTTGAKTPPDHASLGIYISEPHLIPVTMDSGSVLMFDDPTNQNLMYSSSHPNAPTSSQSIDILLSPLQDYEKLKLIENEVAESAKHYSTMEHTTSYGVGNVHMPHMPDTMGTPPLSTSKSTVKKKSGKKNGDRPPKTSSQAKGSTGAAIGGISATTNGVRRERSLHHCTICSKAFKDKYSVNVHIRTHTGEKPFACSVCGKSFRQKAHLAKHYHTHIVQKTPDQSTGTKTVPGKSR